VISVHTRVCAALCRASLHLNVNINDTEITAIYRTESAVRSSDALHEKVLYVNMSVAYLARMCTESNVYLARMCTETYAYLARTCTEVNCISGACVH
jgi:hypothetical protein